MAHSFPNNSASDYHGEQREASITRKGQRNRGHTLSFDRSWLVCTLAFSTGRSFTLKAVIVVVYVCHTVVVWVTLDTVTMSSNAIWKFFTKSETDKSKAKCNEYEKATMQRNYYFSPTTFVCLTLHTDFVYWHRQKAMAFIVQTVSCCSS